MSLWEDMRTTKRVRNTQTLRTSAPTGARSTQRDARGRAPGGAAQARVRRRRRRVADAHRAARVSLTPSHFLVRVRAIDRHVDGASTRVRGDTTAHLLRPVLPTRPSASRHVSTHVAAGTCAPRTDTHPSPSRARPQVRTPFAAGCRSRTSSTRRPGGRSARRAASRATGKSVPWRRRRGLVRRRPSLRSSRSPAVWGACCRGARSDASCAPSPA